MNWVRSFCSFLFWSLLLLGVMLFANPPSVAAMSNDEALQTLYATQKAFSQVAKNVSPAVVYIQTRSVIEREPSQLMPSPFSSPFDLFNDEFFERFFPHRDPFREREREQQRPRQRFFREGQGSGFIINEEGYILTNHHVIGEADEIRVTLADGREFEAEMVGADQPSDVGVIKIEANTLPYLTLGDSDKIEVGQWVVAVGNPFGLTRTVTAGIISAKGRSNIGLTDYEDFIQTDAAINPGNSGGPLVNLEGEVIGINTAIFTRSGGYMGIGFAIPVNMAKAIYTQLVEHGEVTRGFLGIVIQPLTQELAEALNIDRSKGILISEVTPDSPAHKAGLKQGDLIVELNAKPVSDTGKFRNQIALTPPGTEVTLTILRNSQQGQINVTVGERTDETSRMPTSEEWWEKLGFTVQELTPELAQRFGFEDQEGVLVSEVHPRTPAALAGLRSSELILEVNQKPVSSMEDFKRAASEAINEGRILLLVNDGQFSRYIAFKLN